MLYYDESSKNWGVPTFWRINQFEVPNMNWHLKKKSKNFLYQYIFSFVDVAYKCYWSHIRFFLLFCLVSSGEMRIFPGLEVFHVLSAPLYSCTLLQMPFENTIIIKYMGFSSFISKFLSYSMKHTTKEIMIFIFRN